MLFEVIGKHLQEDEIRNAIEASVVNTPTIVARLG